jgi:hypothetical protein
MPSLKQSRFGKYFYSHGDFRPWFVITSVGLVSVLFISLLTIGIVAIFRNAEHNACNKYETETGRATKFVTYRWDSWECMTPSSDDKWIPIDQLREEISK